MGRRSFHRRDWEPKQAEDIDPEQVFELHMKGSSPSEIAAILETTERVIDHSFERELKRAKAERRRRIFDKQWEVGVEKGDKTMLIWLGKQEGQTDRMESAAEYKTFEVVIGEPIPNDRIPPAPGAIAVLEE